MIEVKNLSKKYGDKQAVKNISFKVEQGEILGFLGPNGAGKSTTMNMLTGYISSTSGQILVNGVDIFEDPKKAKSFIGYLPEIPPLYVDMTIDAYLNFVYDLKKCKLPRKAHLKDVCDLCKITDVKNRIIKNLSKGYRQRVGLAQALINKQLTNEHKMTLRIEGSTKTASDKDEIVKAIKSLDGIKYVRADMEREQGIYDYDVEANENTDIRRSLNELCRQKGWNILMLQLSDMTLEDIFLKITMGENNVKLEPNQRPRINLEIRDSDTDSDDENQNGGND